MYFICCKESGNPVCSTIIFWSIYWRRRRIQIYQKTQKGMYGYKSISLLKHSIEGSRHYNIKHLGDVYEMSMDDTQLWHHRSWGRCNIAKSIALKLALSGRTYQEFRLSILTKLHAIKLRICNVIRCDSVLLVRFTCAEMYVICK